MTYERKHIASMPSRPVKPRPKGSGIFRAVRRPKPGVAFLRGMQEWSDRAVRELVAELVKVRDH